MAVVKGAFHCDQASGNVGALCASRWRDLQIMRDAWTGTVPNTGLQQTYQADMTTISQYWGGTCSVSQRTMWEDRAKTWLLPNRFGEMVRPSGYILFMHVNMIRKRHSQAITPVPLEIPPAALGSEFTITVDYSVPRAYMKFYSWFGSPDRVEFWRAGPFDSGGRKPIAGEWRYKAYKAPGSIYYDTTVVADKWYWYRARWVEFAGYCSNFFQKQVQII